MVKKGGDSERADAAGLGSDGGEVGALADFVGEIAFEDAFFGGGASVDNGGAGGDVIVRN